MNRRGERISLHERIHGTPPSVQHESTSARAGPRSIGHCWVTDEVTDEHGRLPGLLLEWRRTASGWQGRVVRPALDAGEWILVDEWLPSELLERAVSPNAR